MYSEKVLDHFTNPRNVGEIPDADGVGEVGNARCGDIMKMYLKIDGDTITDVKFKTFGCGAAIATSSIATEMIKGRTIEEALQPSSNRAVVEALDGLPCPPSSTAPYWRSRRSRPRFADYYTPSGHRSRTHRRSCQKGCPRGRRGGRCLPLLRHLRPLRIKKIPSPLSGGGIFSF